MEIPELVCECGNRDFTTEHANLDNIDYPGNGDEIEYAYTCECGRTVKELFRRVVITVEN